MEQKEHPNALLLKKLWGGLAAREGETMASCYTDDAEFSDPVFPELKNGTVKDMVNERSLTISVENAYWPIQGSHQN